MRKCLINVTVFPIFLRSIIELLNTGRLEKLRNKWWTNYPGRVKCPAEGATGGSLLLEDIGGEHANVPNTGSSCEVIRAGVFTFVAMLLALAIVMVVYDVRTKSTHSSAPVMASNNDGPQAWTDNRTLPQRNNATPADA